MFLQKGMKLCDLKANRNTMNLSVDSVNPNRPGLMTQRGIAAFYEYWIHRRGSTQGSYKNFQPVFKDFSRTTFDFQGPPNRKLISQIVQKFKFPVHSNKTFRLELFAPPTSLHFSVHLSSIDCNYCISTSLSNVSKLCFIFCLGQAKSIKKHFPGHYIQSWRKSKEFSSKDFP